MGLDRDHLVAGGTRFGAVDVRVELIERLTTHSTISAVLEDQNGPLTRLSDSSLDRFQVMQGRRRFHGTAPILAAVFP
jgi:hypothetical protein